MEILWKHLRVDQITSLLCEREFIPEKHISQTFFGKGFKTNNFWKVNQNVNNLFGFNSFNDISKPFAHFLSKKVKCYDRKHWQMTSRDTACLSLSVYHLRAHIRSEYSVQRNKTEGNARPTAQEISR